MIFNYEFHELFLHMILVALYSSLIFTFLYNWNTHNTYTFAHTYTYTCAHMHTPIHVLCHFGKSVKKRVSCDGFSYIWCQLLILLGSIRKMWFFLAQDWMVENCRQLCSFVWDLGVLFCFSVWFFGGGGLVCFSLFCFVILTRNLPSL